MDIKTICKDCVFATFANNEQLGCSVELLGKYIKNGSTKIEKIEDVSGIKHYILYDRMCIGCRLKDSYWVKSKKGLDLKTELLKEIQFKYDIIVYIHPDTTLEQIQKTTESIIDLSGTPEQPTKVIYLYKDSLVSYSKMLSYINYIYYDKHIIWQLKKIEDDNINEESSVGEAILDTVSEFCTVWNAGSEISVDFIKRISFELRENMSMFIMILPDIDSHNGLVIMKKAFIAAGGASEIEVDIDGVKKNINSFIEKIIVLSSHQNKQGYIWDHNFQQLQ